MVNRPAGGPRSKKWPRADKDWYCDAPGDIEPLFEALDLGENCVVYDPSCGRGNILDVAARRGFPTIGSDLVERGCPIQQTRVSQRHQFFRADFLRMERLPQTQGRALVIMNNPPYSYVEDIAEAFIRKALDFPVRKAIFILPIAFLASAGRYGFFSRDFPPSQVCIYSDRPTMPPGEMIEAMGAKAFKGGMSDYCALAYTPPHRWRTETIWLRPQ